MKLWKHKTHRRSARVSDQFTHLIIQILQHPSRRSSHDARQNRNHTIHRWFFERRHHLPQDCGTHFLPMTLSRIKNPYDKKHRQRIFKTLRRHSRPYSNHPCSFPRHRPKYIHTSTHQHTPTNRRPLPKPPKYKKKISKITKHPIPKSSYDYLTATKYHWDIKLLRILCWSIRAKPQLTNTRPLQPLHKKTPKSAQKPHHKHTNINTNRKKSTVVGTTGLAKADKNTILKKIFAYAFYYPQKIMHSTKNKKKWWFTLVEMLIVIVIIGILASALIPRLNSARGRANDTARKAALQQVSAVMVSYSIDHGVFPACGTTNPTTTVCNLETLSGDLKSAGISTIPTDPQADRTFIAISNDGTCPSDTTTVTKNGQYGYVPIKKNWISRWWFALVAGSETVWGSNTVYDDTNTVSYCLAWDKNYTEVELCSTINETAGWTATRNAGACEANSADDDLRYIYLY